MPAPIAWNRKPLPLNALAALPLPAIRPRGWLREAVMETDAADLEERLMKACLLEDQRLLGTAKEEMSQLLARGGELTDQEVRSLMRYHGVSAEKTIPLRLLAYAKALQGALMAGAGWAPRRAANAGDLTCMALWLYNLTGHKALLELCKLMKAQAPDWMSTFYVFPQTKPAQGRPPMDSDAYCRVYGPTVAAALKVPALQSLFEGGFKNETAFRVGWEKLMRYHGAAHGVFNADPLLAGADPSRRVEPETIAEIIRSLETLLWALGDPFAGDLLEKIVYSALPAAHGGQAANQLVSAGPGYPGGFARYAASLWMATREGGLAAIGYAPCEIRWRLAGQSVRIIVETKYPTEETISMQIRVKAPIQFPLRLRIPAFAEGAFLQVGAEEPVPLEQGFAALERLWQNGDTLTLSLPMNIKTQRHYHQSVSVERGPVTYALPVAESTPWNMALLPERGFELNRQGDTSIFAWAAPVPGWRRRGEAPGPPPIAPDVSQGEAVRVRLIPYGKTGARIAQFPVGNSMQ